MQNIFIYPPVIFVTALLAVLLFSRVTKKFAPQKTSKPKGKTDSYACGEDDPNTKIEPDYQIFFPFAIFFTVLHVAGLMIATLAAASTSWITTTVACLYIVCVGITLAVLYSK